MNLVEDEMTESEHETPYQQITESADSFFESQREDQQRLHQFVQDLLGGFVEYLECKPENVQPFKVSEGFEPGKWYSPAGALEPMEGGGFRLGVALELPSSAWIYYQFPIELTDDSIKIQYGKKGKTFKITHPDAPDAFDELYAHAVKDTVKTLKELQRTPYGGTRKVEEKASVGFLEAGKEG